MAAPNGARQTTNTKKPVSALRRLKQDYMMLMNDPVPYVEAAPLPSNMLEWHYVIRGPEGSPYHNGIYHGKLRFPPDYPFKPPSIYMITPNGRFKPNSRLCLSISDFHPDTWNPTWNLSTILTGLLSFMLENNSTYGSIITSKREKQILAKKSYEYNLNDPLFCELFPDIADEIKDELEKRKEAERASANSAVNNAVKGIGNQISNLINSSDGGNRSAAGLAGRDSTAAATAATGPQSNRFIWSVLYNLIAVVILVIFFYVVRFILRESNLFGSSASS